MAGDADPYSPAPDLRNLAGWIPRGEALVVPGTDHFFGRQEREVAGLIGDWADRALADQVS